MFLIKVCYILLFYWFIKRVLSFVLPSKDHKMSHQQKPPPFNSSSSSKPSDKVFEADYTVIKEDKI
jgi:hypothetical protein